MGIPEENPHSDSLQFWAVNFILHCIYPIYLFIYISCQINLHKFSVLQTVDTDDTIFLFSLRGWLQR